MSAYGESLATSHDMDGRKHARNVRDRVCRLASWKQACYSIELATASRHLHPATSLAVLQFREPAQTCGSCLRQVKFNVAGGNGGNAVN